MKEGYIVWNMTSYGDGYEFFGVYKTYKAALKQLRKVVRARYGKCPRDEQKMWDFLSDNRSSLGGDSIFDSPEEDSYNITYFCENDGNE